MTALFEGYLERHYQILSFILIGSPVNDQVIELTAADATGASGRELQFDLDVLEGNDFCLKYLTLFKSRTITNRSTKIVTYSSTIRMISWSKQIFLT